MLSLGVWGNLDGCDYFVSPQQEYNVGDLNRSCSQIPQVNTRGTSLRARGGVGACVCELRFAF